MVGKPQNIISKNLLFSPQLMLGPAHHHKQIFLSHIKCRTKTVKFCHKIVPLIIPVILYDF